MGGIGNTAWVEIATLGEDKVPSVPVIKIGFTYGYDNFQSTIRTLVLIPAQSSSPADR